jgi:hypothetical protein
VTGTPSVHFTRLQFLYEQLWAKKDNLHDIIFPTFTFPLANTDADVDGNTNPQGTGKMRTAEKLSLSGIGWGSQSRFLSRLPCREDELLVRGAYKEMYDILVAHQEDRLKHIQVPERIPNRKNIILILGQPGIGKTCFLTYVLIRRLLEGKPTIFQVFDGDFTNATHYLINGNGVHQMPRSPSVPEMDNPDIWVLADQKPVGAPRLVGDHSWLVVVTSEPGEANHENLVKHFSPRMFYFPTWDWEEVVAAA